MTTSELPTAPANQSASVRTFHTLRDWIQSGRWAAGDRLPAEQSLVETLAVSRGTVRTALKQLEAAGYLEALKGSGRKLRGRIVARSGGDTGVMAQTIVLLTHVASSSLDGAGRSAGEAEVDTAIVDQVHASGLHLLSLNGIMLNGSALPELMRNRPKGVLATNVVSQTASGQSFLNRLASAGMAVIATGNNPELSRLDRVTSDHAAGAYDLARWLIDRGHRRILQIGSAPSGMYWVQARTQGYTRALTEASLPVLERVEVTNLEPREHAGTGREGFGRRVRQFAGFLAEHVLGPDPVDAVMAQNDIDALLAIASLKLLGKTPHKDVAVVGYDHRWDFPEREWEPVRPLATVDRCNEQIGREMTRMLLDRIAGKLPEGPQCRVVAHRLVTIDA